MSAQYIAGFATALAGSQSLVSWCITNFGRPPLIRKQENPAKPLGSDDAPWICLLTWTGAEFGETASADSCAVNVSVGISDLKANDVEDVPAATVTQERTATVAGIEEVGDAALAEEFLVKVVDVLKASNCGGLIKSAGADSDGWSLYPLQIASAVLAIDNPPNTF